MGKRYDEYQICRKRGHYKSGRTQMLEGSLWEMCKHCHTAFRYVTEIKEANGPKSDE